VTAAKDAYYGDPNRCPPRPKFQGENVPRSIRKSPRWVGWRLAWKDERWTKLPLNPNSGCKRAAKSNDPQTWADLKTTIDALNARGHLRDLKTGAYAVCGPGFVFDATGDFGLDIDGCRNPDTGELTEFASRIIREFGTYAEVSPSGMGVKLFGRGSLPWTKGQKVRLPDGQELELYDRVRFFCVTGQRLEDGAEDLTNCQSHLDAIITEHFPPSDAIANKSAKSRPDGPTAAVSTADEKVVELVCRRHSALWNGDTSGHGGDDSRADLALCNLIAFYVGSPDFNRIDTIFRQSGLYRGKWERPDYRAMTISKALQGRTNYYDPSRNGKPSKNGKPVKRVASSTATSNDGEENSKPGAEIILEFFREHYRPVFRRRSSIVCADGSEVSRVEVTSSPNFRIIALLSQASDAPKVNNTVATDRFPAFFKKWSPVAWGEMLSKLPDEDEADLGDDGPAREEFRRLIYEAMLTQVVLGDVISGRDEGVTQTERRSLIDWCKRFGKEGVWRSIRSYQCWCKKVVNDGGEVVLSVAIRHGLMSQLHADKRLRDIPQKKFTRRCARYGVGTTSRAERPHGQNAIILAPEFVEDLA
jgi:hypothetical protein